MVASHKRVLTPQALFEARDHRQLFMDAFPHDLELTFDECTYEIVAVREVSIA
jgi:hypothetical protein